MKTTTTRGKGQTDVTAPLAQCIAVQCSVVESESTRPAAQHNATQHNTTQLREQASGDEVRESTNEPTVLLFVSSFLLVYPARGTPNNRIVAVLDFVVEQLALTHTPCLPKDGRSERASKRAREIEWKVVRSFVRSFVRPLFSSFPTAHV